MPKLGVGLNLSVPRVGAAAVGAAAPSGIVAATAGNLYIDFGNFGTQLFVKTNNENWNNEGSEENYHYLTWNYLADNRWWLSDANFSVSAISPVGTSAIIPTDGWTYFNGSGVPITITAA